LRTVSEAFPHFRAVEMVVIPTTATLRVLTLGRCRLTLDGAPLVSLTSAKAQALLVYLAVTGAAHHRSALAGLLWSDLPERAARANLRLILTKIRKVLPGYLTTRDTIGYAADHPIWVDAVEFAARLDDDDPAVAASALGLYAGEFLGDLHASVSPLFDDWAQRQRRAYHGLALAATDRLLTTARERADHGQGITIARRILELEPFHEHAHRALMWFLAANGQRNAALAQYETCRHILATELAVTPSPETAALAGQIARSSDFTSIRPREPAPAPVPAPAPAPVAVRSPAPAMRAQLPAFATPFMGREAELERLVGWFADDACRVVTLAGPGGVGKTRLAVAMAERLRPRYDDVAYASFAGVAAAGSDAAVDLVVTGIAQAVGLPLDARRDPFDILVDHLATRSLLIVLDNVEQLRDAGEVLVRLAAQAPHVHLLVTSRVRLGLSAEWVAEVRGLPFPATSTDDQHAAGFDAVGLFVARARAVRADFDLAADAGAVARICRVVEGFPLAIELAARWMRALPVAEVAGRMSTGLDLLVTAAADVEARHRSMRSVLEWSWRLLPAAAQPALAGLSTFHAGFDLAAAESVAGASAEVLAALVDHSLIHVEPDGRYTTHELIRQYAADRLGRDPATEDDVRRRHAAHFERRATRLQSSGDLAGDLAGVVAVLDPDVENLRAASGWLIRHADPERLAAHLDNMFTLYRFHGWFRETVATCSAALDRRDVDPVIRARWTRVSGQARLQLGELLASRELLEHAAADLGRVLPSSPAGWVATLAVEVIRRAVRHLRPGPRPARSDLGRARSHERAWAYVHLTEVVYLLEDRAAAATVPLLALNAAERAGDPGAEALGKVCTGLTVAFLHANGLQKRYIDAAVRDAGRSSDPLVDGYVRMAAAVQRLGLGSWDPARKVAELGIHAGESNGLHRITDELRLIRAFVDVCTGRFAEALAGGAAAAESGRRRGDRIVELWGLLVQIEAALPTGGVGLVDLDHMCHDARRLLAPGIPRCDAVRVHSAAARVSLYRGNHEQAWAALRNAAALLARPPLPPPYALPGLAGLAEVAINLRTSPAVPERSAADGVSRLALRRLRQYAGLYPAALPAYHLHNGSLRWLDGRRSAAHRSWARAAHEADSRGTPYELACAHYEIGRHLPLDRGPRARLNREQHLTRAYDLFEGLGCTPATARVDQAAAG